MFFIAVRFLVRLKNAEGLTPLNIPSIHQRAHSRLHQYHASVGNIRVSSRAIEMDLFPPNLRDAPALAQELEVEFGEIVTLRQLDLFTPPPSDSHAVIVTSRDLFNEERFWETHEEVEALWKIKKKEEKELLQGFILVAVALVHLQKDERDVCLSVLGRAAKKLEGKVDEYEGLDLRALRDRVQAILRTGKPEPFVV